MKKKTSNTSSKQTKYRSDKEQYGKIVDGQPTAMIWHGYSESKQQKPIKSRSDVLSTLLRLSPLVTLFALSKNVS